jgi:hypothetical protein
MKKAKRKIKKAEKLALDKQPEVWYYKGMEIIKWKTKFKLETK